VTAYEYRSVVVPATKADADLSALEELGRAGWEAFSAVPAALDGYAYAEIDGLLVLLRRQLDDETCEGGVSRP